MSEWKKHVDKHETRFKPTIYGTHPKIDSLNLKMMGLEDDFPDFQGARILRFQPFIFRSVYTRKTGICYISLPSTSEKGSWIYLILSGPLGVIFIKTTPRFMGRFCCTPCKRVSFFFGGGPEKSAMAFLNCNLPPKKKHLIFLKLLFFQLQSPVANRSFGLFPQMIAPLFMVSDINKQQKRGNLREPSLVNGSKTQRWRFLGCYWRCFCSLALVPFMFLFFCGGSSPGFSELLTATQRGADYFWRLKWLSTGSVPTLAMRWEVPRPAKNSGGKEGRPNYMRISKNRGIPKWMVYNIMENLLKWMIWG